MKYTLRTNTGLNISYLKKSTLLLLIVLLIFNCDNTSIRKYYYDTGELSIIDSMVNKQDSVFYTKVYSKLGYLESEGLTKNEKPFGLWTEYFSDGMIKWQGTFKNGLISIPLAIEKQFASIEVEGTPKILKVGQEYKLRTYVESVPPSFYAVVDSNFVFLDSNKVDPEKYPLIFTPQKAGKFYIQIVLPDSTGTVTISKSWRFIFSFRVEDELNRPHWR